MALEWSWGISDVEEWGGKGCFKSIINGKVKSCHYAVAMVWTSHSNIAFVCSLSWRGGERERSRAVPALCWMQEVNGIDAASFPVAQGRDHTNQKIKRSFMWFSGGALPQFLAAFLHLTQMKNHIVLYHFWAPATCQERG